MKTHIYSKKDRFIIPAMLALLYAPACFSAAANVPATAEASRAGQPFTIPLVLHTKDTTPVAVAEPEVPQLSKEAAAVRFKLNGLVIEGNTIYPQAELYWLFRNYLDHDVSLAQLQEITQLITLKYHNSGYILSRAYIPPQRVQNGVVHIRVVEGYVSSASVEGNVPSNTKALIQKYGNHVVRSGPLRVQTLERYVLLSNDLPGIKVRAVLKPSTIPDAADLVLMVTEADYGAYNGYNNRGTRYLGPDQFLVGGAVNNVIRAGDSTEIRGMITRPIRNMQFLAASHQQQLGSDGLRITLNGDYTHTEPGSNLQVLGVNGRNQDLFAVLTFPVLRTREENFYVNTTLDYTHSRTDLVGNTMLFDDRFYYIAAGGNYDVVDKLRGANTLRTYLTQGLSIFNATHDNQVVSRPDARPDFTKINVDISREQLIGGPFSLLVQASGQYAFNPLFSSLQFGVGSSPYGGAYDPSEIVGDHGVGAKAELRFLVPQLAIYQSDYMPTTQLYTYYDGGQVWNINHTSQPASQSLTSIGLGARFNFPKYFSAYFEVTKPLTKRVAAEAIVGKGNNTRYFVGISGRV